MILKLPKEMSENAEKFLRLDAKSFPLSEEFKGRHISQEILKYGIKPLLLSDFRKQLQSTHQTINDEIRNNASKQTDIALSEYEGTSELLDDPIIEKYNIKNICNVGAHEWLSNEEENNKKILTPSEIIEKGNQVEYEIKARSIGFAKKNLSKGKMLFECGEIAGREIRKISEKRESLLIKKQ